MSFEIEISDGGRSFSKRPRQKEDCTVRALAIATGADYDVAYDLLKEYGRRSHRRFPFSTLTETVRLGHIFVCQKFDDEYMTPVDFCERYSSGTFICQIKGHVFCVKDGVVWDTGKIRDDRQIVQCWRIEKARTAKRRREFTPYVHGSDD